MKSLKRILSVFLIANMLITSAPLTGFDGLFAPKAEAASMKDTISSMSVGDTITYGSYPQTDVTSSMGSVLTAAAPSTDSWNSYNYYIDGAQSDYMKYYDLSYNGNRYRGVYFTQYRPYCFGLSSSSTNTYQDDNGYTTSKIYWFRYESLTWRILDPKTGYVICENIIDSQAFNDEYYTNGSTDAYGYTAYYSDKTCTHLANNWEYSTIRKWLNETFYTTAFSSGERSQIPCTKHTTPAYFTSFSAYDVGETGDYVFLPTYQDMIYTSYGFSSDRSSSDINRRAHSSDYAKSQGADKNSSYQTAKGEDTSHYRLRSAGCDSYYATGVGCNGGVSMYWSTYDIESGIRPALCFNPSSIGNYAGSSKYNNDVTINVYSTDSYDGLNKLPVINIGTELKNFTVTTSSGSQTVTDASSVKIDIAEAKRGDVKISKNYYQDYIIPSEVFENVFNDRFYASLSVEMSRLPSTETGYISTAFAKEDGEYSSYTDTVTSSIKVTKGNKYKVILKGAGLGSNVKYYLSQNGVHKIESTTGVFEGDLFSQFIPYNDIYAYAVSSKGTTPLIKLKMEVVPAVQNKELDDFLKSNSTNILGDAPTSLTGQTGNLFFDGAEFDLSAFKIPLSVGIDGNTVKVAIGIDGALSYSHETKDSSTTGTKWKKDGEWSNFVKDYKEYFEKDHNWETKKEKAKEANNKAKELTEKYGKNTSVKSKSKDFSLDVVGYGIWEIVWNGDQMNLVFKEGSAAVTGSLSYEYCQNGFVGPCPGYMYFGFGASLTASAKNSRSVADSSVPMQWEFSISLEPEVTAGAGVGWKNWASLGLYGKASAPIYLRPALINKTGNFKIDVKGEIGVEATALFVFKTKKPLLDGTLNVIDKTWTNTKSLKAPAMYAPYSFTSEAKTEAPKMVEEVESTDRSYASETSQWLGIKSVLNSKAYSKAKALNLSGMKFTTLQENVFYAPQTQVALVGDKVLMTFVEDDTTRTANNRMRLMYTLYDPATDSWSQPKPVSDNGRNDSYPYLVSNGNNTYITWIKSNTLYPDDLSNTVDVFKACEVYLAQFDAETEDFTNVTRVTDDTVYDYSPSVAIDSSGNPVVYYASCTDNDTFGKNNTITKYTGTKTVLASGKYYILSMTANSDATELTYVMDKNGDTSDSTGVNAYTIKSAETTEINHETAIADVFYANLNGEEKLFFSDRTNIYYLDSNGEETAVLNSCTGISSAVCHIENDDGLTFIFTKKDGEVSELFSVSQTDNGWTEPVQISNEEKLIENIAVASNGNILYGCITTKENEKTDLVGFSFNDFTDVSLGDISISELGTNAGEDNKFTVSVFNNGTNKIDSLDFTVSDTLGTNSEQTVEVNIEPGEMKIVELIYPAPENYSTTTLTVSADVLLDKNTDDNTVTNTIGLPDVGLEEPIVEENADYYFITTYAENVSDIPAKNVSVSVKADENNLIEPIQYDEIALLQKEEISLILPKSCVTYDEDGFARVTISAVCGEDSDEVIAVLTDNSKNANGECSHIETELKETPATCKNEGKAETVCVSCGEVLGVVATLEKTEHTVVTDKAVAATCTKSGKTEGKHCSVCGTVIEAQTSIPKLDHDYNSVVTPPTCTNEGYTTYTCSRCKDSYTDSNISSHGHTSDEGTVTKPATCTTTGTKTYKCTVCGENIKTEDIPATGHQYVDTVTAPTCTAEGYTTHTCSVCGDTYTDTVAKASGHKSATAVKENIKAASCTATGSYDSVVYCSVCKAEISRSKKTVAKTAHKYIATVIKPTCTTNGYTAHKCSVCGNTYTDTVVKATGHKNKTKTIPATTSADGKIVTTCTVCKKTLKTTPIYKASSIMLSGTSYIYNGKVQKPTLIVKDSKGNTISSKYYTATWSNSSSKYVGTYTITLKLKGNYSCSQSLTYKIVPQQVTGFKVSAKTTSLTLAWGKVTGAKYYKIEKYNASTKKWETISTTTANSLTVSKLKAGTKYYFRVTALDSTRKLAGKVSATLKTYTLCTAPTIKLASTKSKTATVTITKVTGASKYVIYKSTDGKKWTKVTTTTSTSYNLTKLTGGKRIYVKVQAVNAAGKASAYSSAKYVTVKK